MTLGLGELVRSVGAAGFANVAVHLPFPDYKFPRVILTDLPNDVLRRVNLAEALSSGTTGTGRRSELFVSRLAWGEVQRNDLLPALSNSFLLFASPSGDIERNVDWAWEAVALSTRRRKRFRTVTEVRGLGGDDARVLRRRLHPEERDGRLLRQQGYEHPWRNAPSVGLEVARAMQDHRCDVARIAEVLSPWIEFLRSQSVDGQVPGELLDATADNGVRINDRYALFDHEFTWHRPIPLERVIARGLFYVIRPAIERPGALRRYPGASVARLMMRVGRRVGLTAFGWKELGDFVVLESAVQHEITGTARWRAAGGIARALAARTPLWSGLSRRPVVVGRVRRVRRAIRSRLG